ACRTWRRSCWPCPACRCGLISVACLEILAGPVGADAAALNDAAEKLGRLHTGVALPPDTQHVVLAGEICGLAILAATVNVDVLAVPALVAIGPLGASPGEMGHADRLDELAFFSCGLDMSTLTLLRRSDIELTCEEVELARLVLFAVVI